MSDKINLQVSASQEANNLNLTVTNQGAAISSPLGIAFDIDKTIFPASWADRVKAAGSAHGRQASAADLVTLNTGWSAWVKAAPAEAHNLRLIITNIKDDSAEASPLAAGGTVAVSIPIQPPKATNTAAAYQTSTKNRKTLFRFQSQEGSLHSNAVTLQPPAAAGQAAPPVPAPSVPGVKFWVGDRSNVIGAPGRKVTLHWELGPELTGTLWGSLPGGVNQKQVRAKDSLTVRVVGHQAYLLQVETEELAISRSLSLDVTTDDKFGYLKLVPERTLANSIVQATWAVRDVQAAELSVGDNVLGSLLAEEQTSGVGSWKIIASETTHDLPIKLTYTPLSGVKDTDSATLDIWQWEHRSIRDKDGQPLNFTDSGTAGFAYGGGRLAWAQADGSVRVSDPLGPGVAPTIRFDLISPPIPVEEIVAFAGYDKGFALWVQSGGQMTFLFIENGQFRPAKSITMTGNVHPAFEDISKLHDCHLAGLASRVYVMARSENQSIVPFSMEPDSNGILLEWGLLSALCRAERLLAYPAADNLYVYGIEGRVFLCKLNETAGVYGTLSLPHNVAPWPYSMSTDFEEGSLIFVASVGLLLNNGETTSQLRAYQGEIYALDTTDQKYYPLGLGKKGTPLTATQLSEAETYQLAQDWLYNPQTNQWQRCGHGLDLTANFVACDNRDPARLWAPIAKLPGDESQVQFYTLSVGSGSLFTSDYIEGNGPAELPQAVPPNPDYNGVYLREIDLHGYNLSGKTFVRASLASLDFSGMTLEDLDFSGANLFAVSLKGATLRNIDFSGAQLNLADLHGADLSQATNLDSATLSGAAYDRETNWPEGFDYRKCQALGPEADLRGLNLEIGRYKGLDLTQAIYDDKTVWKEGFDPASSGAILLAPGVDLSRRDLSSRDLSKAELEEGPAKEVYDYYGRPYLSKATLLSGSRLQRTIFSGADLRGADFSWADLTGADLREALLQGAKLDRAILQDVDLRGTDLSGVDFSGVDFNRVKLDNANLRGANLSRANLRGASLNGAILEMADLRHADLREPSIQGANLSGAIYDLYTRWPDYLNYTQIGAIGPFADFNYSRLQTLDLSQLDIRGVDLRRTKQLYQLLDPLMQVMSSQETRPEQFFKDTLFDTNVQLPFPPYGIIIWGGQLVGDFAGVNLGFLDLSKTQVYGANFRGAIYNRFTKWPEGFPYQQQGAFGPDTRLETVDATGLDLSQADFSGAKLWQVHNLDKANLVGARYNGETNWPPGFYYRDSGAVGPEARLAGTNFRNANLRYVDLQHADLRDAILCGTFLKGANLQSTDFRTQRPSYSFMIGAVYDDATEWPDGFWKDNYGLRRAGQY